MAFLRKSPNREGKIYYYIAQNYRENGRLRQRTIRFIGRHDLLLQEVNDPETYAKEQVNEYNQAQSEEILVTKTISTTDRIASSQKNIGYLLLESIYSDLGISTLLNKYSKSHKFKYSLDKVMKLLAFGRILDPKSKLATVEEFQKKLFGNWGISYNDVDRSLDHFERIKEDVQFLIHKSVSEKIGRTATLVFYDVTNYYWETDIDDKDETDENGEVIEKGLRKRGPSKEKRPNPIVQMGLFMDLNGIPIAYKLFEGNHTDPITYIPAIEQVKKQFGIERIVTVADKAMNSAKNVTDAYLKGDGWLFSQKFRGQKGSPKDIQNFVLDKNGWQYNRDLNFAKKSIIIPRKLSNGEMVDQKILVTWKEKYAIREKIRRNGAVDFANNLRNPEKFRQTMRRGGKKYLKMTLEDVKTGQKVLAHPYLDIDQDLVDFDAQFDGMNVIVTSETSMSDEEMIAAYGQLNKIEDCFRVTKTEFHARPAFVWTREHIEAHFLTCFVALVILRIMQHRTSHEYSPRKLINALESLNAKPFAQGYYEVEADEVAVELLGKLGIDWTKQLQPFEAINSLNKVKIMY